MLPLRRIWCTWCNGVILITTKRGQLGKPKVTLRSEYAVLTGLRYPEYINAAEYAGLMNEARDNAGVANMAYTDEEMNCSETVVALIFILM